MEPADFDQVAQRERARLIGLTYRMTGSLSDAEDIVQDALLRAHRAGLDGVENELDPGKRLDIDMYADGHKVRGAKKLPLNLLDAIRAYEKDKVLRSALGVEFSNAYIKLKTGEWNAYCKHLTQWERDNTLDC